MPSSMPSSDDRGEFCIYHLLSSMYILFSIIDCCYHSVLIISLINTSPICYKTYFQWTTYYPQIGKIHKTGNRYTYSYLCYIKCCNRDTTSLAAKEIRPRYTAFRPDCIILAYSGIEVATIEVKPLNTNKKLVETDLCKVAEVCKRQLHLRMKVARKSKEFKTFGVVVAGRNIVYLYRAVC